MRRLLPLLLVVVAFAYRQWRLAQADRAFPPPPVAS